MASKYFKPRNKNGTTILPGNNASIFNDPNIDNKYKELATKLTLSLIKSGENLLNSFNATTVTSIPESIIPANDSLTRLNDRSIPQSFKTQSPQVSRTRNKYLEKINLIVTSIEKKVKFSKKNNSSLISYFGKIDPGSGTFYPRIIKYDANNNPFYDMRVSINNINIVVEAEIEIRASHVPE
jgi:hypothetical protein